MSVTEHVAMREKRRESLILLAFSLFAGLMAVVTLNAGWSVMIVLLLAGELVYVWWAYITGFQDHMIRAVILTILASIDIFLYGVNAENFIVIIPTLCVFAVLFSLYRLTPIMHIVIITMALLFIYHMFVEKTFVWPKETIEFDRLILQIMSLVVVLGLCIYSIGRSKEEDADATYLEQEVARTQKIKDDFVANTSHELRTPINTISGMSDIILQEDLPEDVHRDVLDIQMTGIELQTIVTDILDYAALESGTLTLSPRSYNITSTLNDVMNMTVFSNREKDLELIFDCDPGIPRLLYGDEQQLRRVLNNLIGNAIKFTKEGGITVKVGYRKEDYGINLIVSVKDTGIGLTQEEQERIFQGFYQADSKRNRQVEGMGLGLTISSSLIRKMGGFLTLNSEKNVGSEFMFSIPQRVMDDGPCMSVEHPENVNAIWYFNATESDPAIRDDYIASIRHISENLGINMVRAASLSELKRSVKQREYTHLIVGANEYNEDPLYFDEISEGLLTIVIVDRDKNLPKSSSLHILYKPYNAMTIAEMLNGGGLLKNPKKYQESRHFIAPTSKVLVVDDNIMNLKVVEGLLQKYRIKITAAPSGEEALSQVDSKDYDIIFMDHMMPGMDGIECMHKIREKQGVYFERVPIIALTANAIAGSKEMFLEEGFDDFVAKPIDNSILDDVLQKYIPKDKQTYIIESNDAKRKDIDGDPFAEMKDIDMETALTYCGGALEDYIDLAKIYYSSGEKYTEDLKKYYAEKDWKNYSILVHAIKSTSKTIGAMKLSEIAYKEEMASKNEDVDTIEQYHIPLMKEYKKILDELGNNPKIVEQKERVLQQDTTELSDNELKSLKKELTAKLETFESDAVSEYIDKYRDRSYGGKNIEELMSVVMEKADAFDFDGAIEELSKIGGEE